MWLRCPQALGTRAFGEVNKGSAVLAGADWNCTPSRQQQDRTWTMSAGQLSGRWPRGKGFIASDLLSGHWLSSLGCIPRELSFSVSRPSLRFYPANERCPEQWEHIEHQLWDTRQFTSPLCACFSTLIAHWVDMRISELISTKYLKQGQLAI